LVLDADQKGVDARWRQILGRLKEYSYKFPPKPSETGSIIDSYDDKPRIGIWLMPNNQDAGMLEDFLIQLVPEDKIQVARDAVEMAISKKVHGFKDVHRSKADIHTYLAWQDEPGSPLGQAITAYSLDPKQEIAQEFVAWLKRLFQE
ncbi:MAG: hypothetical protein OEZ36_08460, partial [Spirochaetota bacterium]|nr:hypothetical protein [Spirochaetota bacterium]